MHGHIFTNKPDIIILKQTWLLNSEILPDETFKRLRADRSGKNSLPHWQVKKIDKHVIIGDFNFPEINWPDSKTFVRLHSKFIELLMLELGHSLSTYSLTFLKWESWVS